MSKNDGKSKTSTEKPTKKCLPRTTKQLEKKMYTPRTKSQHTAAADAALARNVTNTVGGVLSKFPGKTGTGERQLTNAGEMDGDGDDDDDDSDDDDSVERNQRETKKTMTSENYVQLLRKRLMKECQSYLNADDPKSDMTSLSANVTVMLGIRLQNAIQSRRIFSIHGYYPIISEELKKRGWLEKKDPELKPPNYYGYIYTTSVGKFSGVPAIESPPSLTPTNKKSLIMENIENAYIWFKIKNVMPNYLFTTKKNYIDFNTTSDTTTLSQIFHLTFCTKVGLIENVEQISKKVNVKVPRTYRISDRKSLNAFIKDYKLTAVLSCLKHILLSKNSQKNIFNANGTIPYEVIDFTEQRCLEFLNAYKTEGINDILWFTTKFEDGWNKFMVWYYKILEESATICLSNSFQINDIFEKFGILAHKIKSFCPQYCIDGESNLWIIKPHNSCSGKGIKLEKYIYNILKILTGPKESNQIYIIQKYIENPLRIFNVKVDLRQYVIITNTYPVQIWMYKEGYLRFCSKKFSFKDLSEAVHVSNIRVQSKYKNYRASNVPEECMWDFSQFKHYLKSIDQDDKWNTAIYPSICETILTIFLKSFRPNVNKKYSFQLLGADFILTDNFEPWLIEINCNPGLNPTTSVITRIATTLLKDIVKGAFIFIPNIIYRSLIVMPIKWPSTINLDTLSIYQHPIINMQV